MNCQIFPSKKVTFRRFGFEFTNTSRQKTPPLGGWGAFFIFSAIIAAALSACSSKEAAKADAYIDEYPKIFPDFTEVTVAPNLVSPRFFLEDMKGIDDAQAIFEAGDMTLVKGLDGLKLSVSELEWEDLHDASDTVKVTVQTLSDGKWTAYKPFNIYVAPDSIDKFIAFRLIEPGYESWNEMGIYQRCLESYRRDPIITNRQTDYGCMNCHSFCQQDPDRMLLHLRVEHGGTYIIEDGEVTKLNTKTPETISALVYPSWHPSGDYVAFSVNDTKQMFHTSDPNRIEVYDNASDVVVYDVRNHEILKTPLLSKETSFETYPTFSPDGKRLYFCTTDSAAMPAGYDRLHYSICAIDFDPSTRTFGSEVDTIYNAVADNASAAFPRVSPDGRFLMFTKTAYGTFPIWHHDADLYMIDLTKEGRLPACENQEDGLLSCEEAFSAPNIWPVTEFNSDDTESYHSWSSNGRWVVFSSRRLDGLYTRPYIGYIAPDGTARKPLVLPPPSKAYYESLMKSFNVPEFIAHPVTVTGHEISETAKNDPGINVSVKKAPQPPKGGE